MITRVAQIVVIALGLAACSDPGVARCEEILKDGLKSPSSYKRSSVERQGTTVYIFYDAENAFGASLRGKFVCEFDGKSSEPTAVDYLES